MANYFVIGDKFRPYSFEELIQPYQMYGQAYKEQETAIDTARESAPSYSDFDLEGSSLASSMYNAATQQLDAASEKLATEGLTKESRQLVRNASRDYSSTMKTLTEAQTKLNTEKQRRSKLINNTVFSDNNALTLDDYLGGANPSFTEVNLEDLTKSLGNEFSRRSKDLVEYQWDVEGAPVGYRALTTKKGLTQDEVNFINNASKWSPEDVQSNINALLNSGYSAEQIQSFYSKLIPYIETVNQYKNAIGYNNFDAANKQRIDNAIREGSSYGIGELSTEYRADNTYSFLNAKNKYKEETPSTSASGSMIGGISGVIPNNTVFSISGVGKNARKAGRKSGKVGVRTLTNEQLNELGRTWVPIRQSSVQSIEEQVREASGIETKEEWETYKKENPEVDRQIKAVNETITENPKQYFITISKDSDDTVDILFQQLDAPVKGISRYDVEINKSSVPEI